MAGMERRKEYSPASPLSSPIHNPAVIVEPEREIPGAIATPCTVPTIIAVQNP